MSDILLDYLNDDNYMGFDIVINNSEIQKDDSLKQAILISLFTDCRCDKSELPQGEISQRGYFGDGIFNEQTGSKLWLINRAKISNDTLIRAKEYATSALSWMLVDGFVKDIQIETQFNKHKNMIINILIIKNDHELESYSFSNSFYIGGNE